MDFEFLGDAVSVALRAAAAIAAEARHAVEQRGKFVMAVSGGHTPWVMLSALANEQVPWDKVEVFQARSSHEPGWGVGTYSGSGPRSNAKYYVSSMECRPCDRLGDRRA